MLWKSWSKNLQEKEDVVYNVTNEELVFNSDN